MPDPYRLTDRPAEETELAPPRSGGHREAPTIALWVAVVILVAINATLSLTGHSIAAIFPGAAALACLGVLLIRHLTRKSS